MVCECCGRSSRDLYPNIPADKIFEVHHIVPLASREGIVRTTVDDLALLCANCHRLVHGTTEAEGNLANLRNQLREAT